MPSQKLRYSIQEKRAACVAYCILGSQSKAAEAVGLDRRTVSAWCKKDWWRAWEQEIAEELGRDITAKMRGVVMESYDQLLDRLENGDVKVLNNGDIVRHPIAAKDLSIIGNVGSDKIRLAEGKATTRSESISLTDSARMFEEIADRYTSKIAQMQGERPIIEGEVVRPVLNSLPGDRS